jgi:hypothetical protein
MVKISVGDPNPDHMFLGLPDPDSVVIKVLSELK